MPYDRNGNLVEVDMLIMIPCRVKAVSSTGTDYCNVTVQTIEPMYPSMDLSTFSLNAKQIVVKD